MVRQLIAVAAASGSLALGAAGLIGTSGVAGAATTPTPTNSPARHVARCAKAEAWATKIHAREAKLAVWLPKAQAREAKATAAGHTTVATAIAGRITWRQQWETHANSVLATIATKCGTTTSPT